MSTQTNAPIPNIPADAQQQAHSITLADVDDQLRSLQHHQLPPVPSQNYYGQQYYPYIPDSQLGSDGQPQPGARKRSRSVSSPDMVKKCSRCRVKRVNEDPDMLVRYQTCVNCRNKRKVKEKKVRSLSKLPNLSDDWAQYQHKVSLNSQIDLYQHNYRNYTDKDLFPRYQKEELTEDIVKEMSELVVNQYIVPLQMLTGFKFAIRDHHKPNLSDTNPNKSKKITWMYICSQDKYRQRKSRSENKRQVINKLKTEECDSKITLNYDLVTGVVQLSYNHKHHQPLNWRKDGSEEIPFQLGEVGEQRKYHELQAKESDVNELSKLLKQEPLDTNEIVELATRAAQTESSSGQNQQEQLYDIALLHQHQQLQYQYRGDDNVDEMLR
ncbi:hypothetical protein OGAPHI_003102 [Ogataea philodendri]|uniref:Uncharacterized protein n=1 Tax=Ogataea philodendri TaxID=1378263 RepID=A0A9P8P8D5_9ASCO|nr:uncharacterized protein OGAPHI_003102 [Ogataea philodendri]KAH3667453.1 hypothetical protein OGAPHI_003102 [Ogataea philodendri]